MSQALYSGDRPPVGRRVAVHLAVGAARLLVRLPTGTGFRRSSGRRRGQRLLFGRYCLQHSVAAAIGCRLRGVWPTLCTDVRTPPFAALAWGEVDGHPGGGPADTVTYRHVMTDPPVSASPPS